MADLSDITDGGVIDGTGATLKNKPPNSLNKTSRKVGIQNPKQRKAIAIKYKKFQTGKL